MSSGNSLLTVAIIAMLVSAVSLGFTYFTISNVKSGVLTGYATANANATINITIASNIAINFTTNNINFGSGSLNPGTVYAVLDTAAGTVVNGTWTPTSTKLVLENIGTANVTLNLMTNKNASSLINGTNSYYQYNVTISDSAAACVNMTGGGAGTVMTSGFTLGSAWYNVNNSALGTIVCDKFGFLDAADAIKIDFRLGIPYDSNNGTLGDIVTATATG